MHYNTFYAIRGLTMAKTITGLVIILLLYVPAVVLASEEVVGVWWEEKHGKVFVYELLAENKERGIFPVRTSLTPFIEHNFGVREDAIKVVKTVLNHKIAKWSIGSRIAGIHAWVQNGTWILGNYAFIDLLMVTVNEKPVNIQRVVAKFVLAPGDVPTKKRFSYYLLKLHFNRIENTITLARPISLTDRNCTYDDGSKSQFYAQVVGIDNQRKTFAMNGTNRFYLGKWNLLIFWDGIDKNGKMTGGRKLLDERHVRVTVPHFPDGLALEVYRTKDDTLAMSTDISDFSTETYSPSCQEHANIKKKYLSRRLLSGRTTSE